MKVSQLSSTSGVPIPTIKFYIREGMLPRGDGAGRTQSSYSDSHVERLDLIATLQNAGLSLSVIKEALRAMDDSAGDKSDFMAIAVGTLASPTREIDPAARERCEAMLRGIIDRRGWNIDRQSRVWDAAIGACAYIGQTWPEALTESQLERYVEVVETIAAFELPDEWNPTRSRSDALKYVVLGTLLFEPLILSLRRLAHVNRGNKLRAQRSAPKPRVARPGAQASAKS